MQHRQTLAEVRGNRRLDDLARRLGHQAAHSGKLADLLFRSARAGIGHDVNRVDHALLVLFFEGLEHFVRNLLGDVAPDGDDFVVAFAVGDRAIEILLLHLHDFVFGRIYQLEFHAGNEHVVDADRNAGLGGIEEAEFLQPVEHHDRLFKPEAQVRVLHQRLHALLLEQAIDKRHIRREMIIENHAPDGRVQKLLRKIDGLGVRHVLIVIRVREVNHLAGVAQADRSEQLHLSGIERHDDFFARAEGAPFALGLRLGLGHVVDAQNHVLRGHCQRVAVGRRKDVVRAEHQYRRFYLRFG